MTISAMGDAQQPNPHPSSGVAEKGSTLEKLQPFMDQRGFEVLVDLFAYGNLWDDIYNGRAEMSEKTFRALMTPFFGFGAFSQIWAIFSSALTPILRNEIAHWWGDKEYRRANSMSWVILKAAGPVIAGQTKGFEAEMACREVLREAGGRL